MEVVGQAKGGTEDTLGAIACLGARCEHALLCCMLAAMQLRRPTLVSKATAVAPSMTMRDVQANKRRRSMGFVYSEPPES